MFFKCKAIKEMRGLLNLKGEREVMAGMNSAREVIRYMLSIKSEKRMIMLVSLWMWWAERNINIRTGGKQRCAAVSPVEKGVLQNKR